MSVVVAYKFAPNPQDAQVGADGVVDWGRAKPSVSEYDPAAISLARLVADAAGEDVVGVTVGTSAASASMAKKNALSKGLDRAIICADDDVVQWNATTVASVLAQLVSRVDGADLLITGDASVDEGAHMMSALVAGFLEWPCFQDVAGIERADGGFVLTQVIPGGTRTIRVTGPVVVAATSDAVPTKLPSMKEILAAAKKPAEVVDGAELMRMDATVDIVGRHKPGKRARKNVMFTGDHAVAEVVAALKADGVL